MMDQAFVLLSCALWISQCVYMCFRSLSNEFTDYGLIIDGATLSAVLKPAQSSNTGNYKEIFLEICRNCSAVLCCRMAPLQKAQVTQDALFRSTRSWIPVTGTTFLLASHFRVLFWGCDLCDRATRVFPSKKKLLCEACDFRSYSEAGFTDVSQSAKVGGVRGTSW